MNTTSFKDTVGMKSYDERTPDTQYKERLREVLKNGRETMTQQGTKIEGKDFNALTVMGIAPMRFRLDNGFPLITERNMSPKESEKFPVTIWKQAVGEIFAFINGARTLDEMRSFGCNWWDPWATEAKCSKRGLETGDMGPGFYGGAFHDFPTSEGPGYNQYKNIIEQILEKPHLRTHFISPWVPQYTIRGTGKTQKTTICPCHGWVHIRVIDNKLSLHMIQRSGDLPIGVPSNIAQYAALTLAIAHVTNTEPYEYVHTISDAHIYVSQKAAVEKMLSRDSKPFPTMKINTSKNSIFDFRYDDFEASDYDPHPGIKGIPVAI